MPQIRCTMEIKRDIYLSQLVNARQNGFIKVVTGPRRCGKSYLLKTLFHNHLLSEGVDESHIIEVDLEDRANKELRAPDALLAFVKSKIVDQQLYFVILDEVQKVDEFVDVLNSLLHIKNADVYVTGSNSHFLSTDIATEFRGRDHQIRVYPLSFSEYYAAVGGDKSDAWKDYYTFGGLPLILSFATDQEKADYLLKLFQTVYMADILERYKIKNDKELRELVSILASSIGSPNNPTKIANTFKSVENSNITGQTIDKYLLHLQEAFVIRKAERFDVKNHIMENVIYNELCLRGYQVDVGQVEVRKRTEDGKQERVRLEVDFVVNQVSQRYYIQSALTIPDKEKEDQETQSLVNIDDSFKKIVIVKDNIKPWRNEKGILIMGLMDFLLNKNSLDL